MVLDYLDFDFSADADGGGSFEAMASVPQAQWTALQAEVLRVLDWAEDTFGPPAPPDEGGDWDYALHAVRETSTPMAVERAGRELRLRAGSDDPPRVTLTFTLTGHDAFCEAFRQAFGYA